MSDKYNIEKILEKPKKRTPGTMCDRHEVEHSHHAARIFEEGRPEERHMESSYVLHIPTELRRPYRSVASCHHQREASCYCHRCVQPGLPSWLHEEPSSRYVTVDKTLGYRSCFHHPYLRRADERDHMALGNGSLAAKVKQQRPVVSSGGSRRKKRHRTAFTPTQLLGLENAFEQSHYSVGEERKQLASFLGLTETQIKVWFQNRRTKWKRIRKEAEEMSSADEEGEVETKYEAHYSQYEEYYQHPSNRYHGHEQDHACEKRWPVHHAWSERDENEFSSGESSHTLVGKRSAWSEFADKVDAPCVICRKFENLRTKRL